MKNLKVKFKTAGVTLGATIGAMLLFIVIIGAGNYAQSLDYQILGNIIMTLFPIVILGYVIWLNRNFNVLYPTAYGLKLQKLFKNIGIGLILPIFFITLSVVVAVVTGRFEVNFIPPAEDVTAAILITIWTLIIVGVWEEFFFRGFVFTTLIRGKFGFHLSALLSSILFSVMHWSSFDTALTSQAWYVGIVLLSYIITLLYALTQSIWSIVSFHLCWNFCGELLDGEHNGIGFITIVNYTSKAKIVDNFMVGSLAVILVIMLVLYRLKLRQLYPSQENYLFPQAL